MYIIYISEFDFLKEGRCIYHIDKTIRESGAIIDDGLHEIFVNTAVDDGTDIADLMACFVKKDVKNKKFPALSNKVQELKTTGKGVSTMCEIMEKYMEESRIEGRIEGKIEATINTALTLKASDDTIVEMLINICELDKNIAIEKLFDYKKEHNL